MSEKPVIFISHSSKDIELARLIKIQLEICIPSVEVFASDIEPGENWFRKVMGNLKKSEAIVTLITPNSVNDSHWVWFELGYFWARHDDALNNLDDKKRVYYPMYWKVIPGRWPNPVKDLQIQATDLSNQSSLVEFFRVLCDQFGGDLSQSDLSKIISKIEDDSKIEISDAPDILRNWRG